MRLSRLLSNLKFEARTRSEQDPEIQSLEYDSRRVRDHSLFFAVRGLVTDGNLYIDQALKQGAAAIASENDPRPEITAPWIQAEAMRPFMAAAADEFYGHPSRALEVVGITGTNGKTTTAFLIHSILRQEAPALLMGTIKTLLGNAEQEAERTTPEAIDIQRSMARALELGCRWGAMEVSSHALAFSRVYQCRFPVAVFTNLTQDHLDFHRTLDEYFDAKRLLFQHVYNPGLQCAVMNGDDAFSARLQPAPEVRLVTFGFSQTLNVYPARHEISVEGTEMDLSFFGRSLSLRSPLVGEHNVYNIMAAAGACAALGRPDAQIQRGVECLRHVPGRFEKVSDSLPFTVIVDYAHTPHALENVLRLCQKIRRNGRVICVFGCGGDRDRAKRPLMGEIAVRHADFAILTSDNPRSESPERIIDDIRAGIPADKTNYETIVDRRSAIARAIERALKDDIILVAGKGHETYQEIQGEKIHFDDREVVRELL